MQFLSKTHQIESQTKLQDTHVTVSENETFYLTTLSLALFCFVSWPSFAKTSLQQSFSYSPDWRVDRHV